MSAGPRRRWIIAGVALLVTALFGARWAAVETAERAWAATVSGGAVYTDARDLARLMRGVVLLAGTLWGTTQIYLVYRAIGSVQVPRRLGNIEIVEAVPQPLLLGVALALGVGYGLSLTLGTGDWWLAVALAAAPPRFDVVDPVLSHDLGYYVGALPWSMRLQNHSLLATLSGVLVVGLLYVGIGALKFQGWRPVAGPHARAHFGTLLATLALVLGWGALLDPAEVVAGAHGPLDHAALTIRLPGSTAVVVACFAVAVVCLSWAWRGRPALVSGAWGLLLVTQITVYFLVPELVRTGRGDVRGPDEEALLTERAVLERVALGLDGVRETGLAEFSSPAGAAASLPLWDAERVRTAARQAAVFRDRGAAAAAALQDTAGETGRAVWLVAPAPDVSDWPRRSPPPDWAEIHRGALTRTPAPLLAVETDTGLAFAPVSLRDSASWFGAGFTEFALASPDTWPSVRAAGIDLDGRWRRTALALALRSPELLDAGGETVLLWRRDARERLERLLPPVQFDAPVPVVAEGALWWVAHGYVTSELFPVVRAPRRGRPVTRYLRHGFVGLVHAASGDTRLFLAPGHDPVSAAWASIYAPLVRPAAEMPAPLAAALPFPRRAFEAAAAHVAGSHGDTTTWQPRGEPFAAAAWLAQGFETGRPAAFVALLAGRMTEQGPSLVLWRPNPPAPRPVTVAGSADTKPGTLRMWPAGGALFSVQALFAEPMAGGRPDATRAVRQVFVSWGARAGDGPTAPAAARNLLAGGTADTTLAARWARAQQLAAQADDALARGDIEEFGRLYDALKRTLGIGRTKLVPPQRPR